VEGRYCSASANNVIETRGTQISSECAGTESNQSKLDFRFIRQASPLKEGERHGLSAVAFRVAGGFEPPTFGLCDLTHLSMRVGLSLHL
jgi:hypothetical protein